MNNPVTDLISWIFFAVLWSMALASCWTKHEQTMGLFVSMCGVGIGYIMRKIDRS